MSDEIERLRDELGQCRIERDRYRREVIGLNKAIAALHEQVFVLRSRLNAVLDQTPPSDSAPKGT